jgi:hypothetical protein
VHQFAREVKVPDAYDFAKLYIAKMERGDSEEDDG